MVDLEGRLRQLDAIGPPDLWPDVQERAFHRDPALDRPRSPLLPWGRVGVSALAVSVAAAAIVFAVMTFRGGGHRETPAPAASADAGSIVFVGGPEGTHLYRMRPDGSGLVRTGVLPGGASQGTWSPDGSSIAFERGISEGRGRLEVAAADGSGVHPVGHPSGVQNEPSWSPAGDLITFFSGNGDLFVIGADGRGLRRVADGHSANCAFQWPAFSPDGSRIVADLDCVGAAPETQTLVIIPVDGGGRRTIYGPVAAPTEIGPVSPDAEAISSPAWSPDGSRIAYAATTSDGVSRVWVINVDGTGRRPVTAGPADHDPMWSPDGATLVFERDLGGHPQLFRIRLDGTDERQLTSGSIFASAAAWVAGPAAGPARADVVRAG